MSLRRFTSLVNIRKHKADLYIGRPTQWGNPFRMKFEDEREWVVAAHMRWLKGIEYQNFEQGKREWILSNLYLLEEKILGCYCSPKPCHGDNYIDLIKDRCDFIQHTCGCDRLYAVWCKRALLPLFCSCLCHAKNWEDKIQK